MIGLKITAKVIAVLIEYAVFAVLFVPYLLFLLIIQCISCAIENSRYNAKLEISYIHSEREALQNEKIDRDYDRRITLLDRIVNYWKIPLHIFSK